MKIRLLLLLTLVCLTYDISATTFTVNVNGRSASTVGTFDWAIIQAVNEANSGGNAIIELDLLQPGNAEGLFLEHELPAINNTSGSIEIRRVGGSGVPPYFFLTLHPNNFNWTDNEAVGLRISGVNVTVKDLKFQNFEIAAGSGLTSAKAVEISGSNGVTLENNIFKVVSPAGNGTGYGVFSNTQQVIGLSMVSNLFEGAINGVYLGSTSGTTNINSNTFTNSQEPVVVQTSSSPSVCNIIGNTIAGTSAGGISFSFYGEAQATIKDNDIDDGGITINNPTFNLAKTLLLENNEISDFLLGVVIVGPQHNWSIINNKFNAVANSFSGTAFHIDNNHSFPSDDFYINFVGNANNLLGLPVQNQGNEIDNCERSFEFEGLSNCHVLNYEVDGIIRVHLTHPVTVMETLINSPYGNHIFLYEGGNQMFSPVENSSYTYKADNSGYELHLEYDLNMNLNSNYSWENTGNYAVEFFKMDANGHEMLEFLGRDIITYSDFNTSAYSGTFTKELYFPNSPNIEAIGITVTALGNVNDPINYPSTVATKIGTSDLTVITIENSTCNSCELFEPIAEGKYWVSAWVSVDYPFQVRSYDNSNSTSPSLSVDFVDINGVSTSQSVQFFPTDEIIDGWQRIVGAFVIPEQTANIGLILEADGTYPTYFDDIRLHPFNASMKSYVYDGETFWLTSELDDNNYATFYEYDNEGGLIRIKKETSRGIVTIQETRSSTPKE